MLVKDLIAALQSMPQDVPVLMPMEMEFDTPTEVMLTQAAESTFKGNHLVGDFTVKSGADFHLRKEGSAIFDAVLINF
jgi:hypothetical protein